MPTPRELKVQSIFDRVEAQLEDALKPLSDLQGSYRSVMGKDNPEIQEKMDVARQSYAERTERLEQRHSRFLDLMNMSDTELQIQNSNERINLNDEPEELREAISKRTVTEDQYWSNIFKPVLDAEKNGLETLVDENLRPFRETLLSFRTADEWKNERLDYNLGFYHKRVSFQGKDIPIGQLVSTYTEQFPVDREYSTMANLNRMLSDSEIDLFRFNDPAVLRELFLSVRSEDEWRDYEPTWQSFDSMEFTYGDDRTIKAQMLMYNLAVETYNGEHSTHYAYVDFDQDKEFRKELYQEGMRSRKGLAGLFEKAGIKVSHREIDDGVLDNDRVQEILLSKMSAEKWSKWEGNASDFFRMKFKLDSYRVFSGNTLRRVLEEDQRDKYNAEKIFEMAGIKPGSDPELLKRRITDRYEMVYGVFDDPDELKEVFLQVQSEDEWAQPQDFTRLRKEKVSYGGRTVQLHNFMMLYGIHKFNQSQGSVEDYLLMDDIQKNPELSHHAASTRCVMDELLDMADIEHKWRAFITDVPFGEADYMRHLLSHGEYDGQSIGLSDIAGMERGTAFRKVRFTDPDNGFTLTGHSLMIFYSALPYARQHGIPLEEAANGKKQGKSNQSVFEEVKTLVGI